MTDNEDRTDPQEYIQGVFAALRRLYNEGYKDLIEGEIVYMTHCALHSGNGTECLLRARDIAFVCDRNEDVVRAYLESPEGEITDEGAEAIVRRLDSSAVTAARFNGWLRVFGFEELKRK